MKKIALLLALYIVSTLNAEQNSSINLGKCIACHGVNFEKKALNKSKIVKDMTEEEILFALKGYKDGSYSSSNMGALMKAQILEYSIEDLTNISKQIKGIE